MRFGARNSHPSTANLFVMLTCVLLLEACQSSTSVSVPVVNDVRATQADQPVLKAKPAPEVARAAPEPERVYPDPEALRGASARDVVDVIGQPAFIRKDQPAEIWQYRGALCTLDIFLYQSITGEPYRVNYIETRSQTNGPASNKDCLVSILKERDAGKVAAPAS